MLNPTDWQILIEQCLPELVYLTIRLYRYICPALNNFNLEKSFDSSDYWQERKPNFDIAVRNSKKYSFFSLHFVCCSILKFDNLQF